MVDFCSVLALWFQFDVGTRGGGGVLDKVSRGSDKQARDNLIPQLFRPIKFSG